MITKKIKDTKPGDTIGKSIYRSKDIKKIASRSPIVAQGTVLNEKIIEKLGMLFGPYYEINVAPSKNKNQKIDNIEKHTEELKTIQKQNYYSLTRDTVTKLYKNVFTKKEIFIKTKEKLLSAFNKLSGILKEFQTTNKLDDKLIFDVGRKLANIVNKKEESFEPALVYIIELEEWDSITFSHSFDVAAISLAFAASFTDDAGQLASFFVSGLMHDIGKLLYAKIEMSDMDYIIKKSGRLTDEEYEQVKKHVEVEPFLKEHFNEFKHKHRENIIYGAIDHHEKFNGYGYTKAKKGNEISYAGRVIAICDVYDAMLRERSYKSAMKPFEAMESIKQMTNQGHFDPLLFKKFYKTMGKYPIGSVIQTNLGIGVVVEQTQNHERPVIFFPEQGEINTHLDETLEIVS